MDLLQLKEGDYVRIITKENKKHFGFLLAAIFLFGSLLFWRFFFYIMDCLFKEYKMFKIFRKSKPIYEQVLLFAGTLLPDEKIIVSKRDYLKIILCKDKYGYPVVSYYEKEPPHIAGFQIETINNFPRIELGEKRTNRNFELKNV